MTADLRLTPQRQAVLDVLRSAHDHPTAGEVLDRVRRRAPGIGQATVYRTLDYLVAHGVALELTLGEGAARYDANTDAHDHLVCTGCGRAIDLPPTLASPALTAVGRRHGFAVTGYDLAVRGRCPDCRSRS
jgi:Fe2+ or Zn2+ uptake regulation protein